MWELESKDLHKYPQSDVIHYNYPHTSRNLVEGYVNFKMWELETKDLQKYPQSDVTHYNNPHTSRNARTVSVVELINNVL